MVRATAVRGARAVVVYTAVVVSLLACGDDATGGPDGGGRLDDGDRFSRYQPAQRLDMDNVAGDPDAIELLDLPEPPRSGFRLIVPPIELAPAEERTGCFAWAYPKFKHRHVYAARLYTTGGLHHSNVYGVPLSDAGRSPYPECGKGQGSVAAQLTNILAGNIMDVLFANSTQVVGKEELVFPPGMAFEVTTDDREITTNIHWFNPTESPMRVEVVYDLFTMPADEVETELVPYYFDNLSFEVPAHMTSDVVSDCSVFGGNLVTMMPHTHERATAVTVELMADDEPREILRTAAFDFSSDIRVFDEPISLAGVERLVHTCTVDNDLDNPIKYGIGKNEMCTLFGYMYPPSAQVMGVVMGDGACNALNIGMNRAHP